MSAQAQTIEAIAIEKERQRIRSALPSWSWSSADVKLDGWRGGQTLNAVAAPAVTLRPSTGEDVAAALQWAVEHRIPLSVFSSGAGPHERGMTAQQSTALLDLSAMNRIINVDARDAMVLIEPGVTYAALDTALLPSGLRSFRPLLPRTNKSVIAAMLEREPFLNVNEQWDVLDPFGSVELLFGTGERFRTGTAARSGTVEQHWRAGLRFLTAFGPGTTDFLRVLQGAQGTLGIVLWAAMMCERIPKVEQAFFIGSDAPEALAELLSWVCWRRLGNAAFIGNAVQMATALRKDSNRINELAGRLPSWLAWVRIGHGGSEFPQEQFDLELSQLQEQATRLGLRVETQLAGVSADELSRHQAQPVNDVYQDRLHGAHVSVFCLHQFDGITGIVQAARELLAAQGWPESKVAIYVQPRIRGRNLHIEIMLPHTPAEAARAQSIGRLLAKTLMQQGGFFSRPYGEWASIAYADNLSLLPYLQQTKALFDPERVLNPGRLCY